MLLADRWRCWPLPQSSEVPTSVLPYCPKSTYPKLPVTEPHGSTVVPPEPDLMQAYPSPAPAPAGMPNGSTFPNPTEVNPAMAKASWSNVSVPAALAKMAFSCRVGTRT